MIPINLCYIKRKIVELSNTLVVQSKASVTIEIYRVLPGFTEFNRVLPSFTEFWWDLY